MTITSAAAVLFFLMGLLIITDAFVPISQQSHRSLELFASSTISPFNSRRQEVSSSLDVRILEPIGNGTFGGVYFAEDAITGDKLIAKTARAAISDETAQQNAKSYLEIEAYINTKLYHESEQHNIYQQHVAPYLGEIEINHTMFLLWKTSGEYTLEDYIEIDDGWVQLAKDLGVEEEVDRSMFHQKFAREILRQLLEGLAYCHSKGVIHRDIKVRIIVNHNEYYITPCAMMYSNFFFSLYSLPMFLSSKSIFIPNKISDYCSGMSSH